VLCVLPLLGYMSERSEDDARLLKTTGDAEKSDEMAWRGVSDSCTNTFSSIYLYVVPQPPTKICGGPATWHLH